MTGIGGVGGVARGELFVTPSMGGTPQPRVRGDIGAAYPIWSPDGRWIVFDSAQAERNQVYVAPFTGDQGPSGGDWIPVTEGSTWEDKLNWASDGNWIYTLFDRDGFNCFWAYPLDALTKKPAGNPIAVFHSHGARQALPNANLVSLGVSVAGDKIVFNQGEVTGNIWMTVLNPD